jgi:hypothetical protein
MAKKKSKGVLEKIGDAVVTGAEAVYDAGAKAVHAVGDLLPAAKPAPKRKKATKAAVKTPKKSATKAEAKTAKPKAAAVKAPPAKPKASAAKVKAAPAKATASKVTSKAAAPKATKSAKPKKVAKKK